MDRTDELARAIFEGLEGMDREATTVRDGHPTGLYWYGGHARPDQRRPQTEPNWTRRLAESLPSAGFPAAAEVPYPSRPRKRCDLVVDLGDGRSAWIEIKGAFKRYWRERGSEFLYRSYLLHPLEEGLDPKTHTAPRDLEKLSWLAPADAAVVGFLLLGFDTRDAPMDADFADLGRLARLDAPPWRSWERDWDDPQGDEGRTRCRLWIRPAGDSAGEC